MTRLNALLQFEEVQPETFTHINVTVPLNTQCLHEILYDYLGAFGNLDDDFVGCDIGALPRLEAKHLSEIDEIARENHCVQEWERIQQILKAAQMDGIHVVILFWEYEIGLPDDSPVTNEINEDA